MQGTRYHAIVSGDTLLPVLHSLGGCGGTPIAQCLGCMPSVVLLSETNPASALLFDGQLNPVNQVRAWYPTLLDALPSFTPAELADERRFGTFIEALHAAALAAGRTLVLRDYNYADYFGFPFFAPRGSSSLIAALDGAFARTPVVLVRHPLDQYDSLRSHRSAADALSPEIFIDGYARFLDDFAAAPVVKYEDFVAEPVATIAALCRLLRVPYDGAFLDRFPAYRAVTGNLARRDDPTIAHAWRERAPDAWRIELQQHPGYRALLARLSYADGARPPSFPATGANTPERLAAKIALQEVELERLRATVERQSHLLARAPWEATIAAQQTRLASLEATCADRLALLEEQRAALDALRAECALLQRACSERLAVIDEQQAALAAFRAAVPV